jgi:hypothetical protein
VPPATPASSWGTLGDTAHTSASDHSPHVYAALGSVPVVCAADFPHAPALGLDGGVFAEALRRSRDPRIAYVIFNRRIFSSTVSPWTWRTYTGSDPHDTHWHVSVVHTVAADDTRSWAMPGTAGAAGGSVTTLDSTHNPPWGDKVPRSLAQLIWEGDDLDRYTFEAIAARYPSGQAAAVKRIELLLLAVAAKVDIDPTELAEIKASAEAGAKAGVLAAQEGLIAALKAALVDMVGNPNVDLSDEAIEAALRRVFADAAQA